MRRRRRGPPDGGSGWRCRCGLRHSGPGRPRGTCCCWVEKRALGAKPGPFRPLRPGRPAPPYRSGSGVNIRSLRARPAPSGCRSRRWPHRRTARTAWPSSPCARRRRRPPARFERAGRRVAHRRPATPATARPGRGRRHTMLRPPRAGPPRPAGRPSHPPPAPPPPWPPASVSGGGKSRPEPTPPVASFPGRHCLHDDRAVQTRRSLRVDLPAVRCPPPNVRPPGDQAQDLAVSSSRLSRGISIVGVWAPSKIRSGSCLSAWPGGYRGGNGDDPHLHPPASGVEAACRVRAHCQTAIATRADWGLR